MPVSPLGAFRRRLVLAGLFLVLILVTGTSVYWFVGQGESSLLDCLYMTVITIATIGYGEIVDLSASPGGRVFTMLISFAGIGIMTFIVMNLTAFVIEGHLNTAFRRRKMEKRIEKMEHHYIVCGLDGVGSYIVHELRATDRPFVVVDSDRERIEKQIEHAGDIPYIEGDATDNDILLKAGIARARGLFAATGDDNLNLVISLTAKQLKPAVRVVAACREMRNAAKMRVAAADAVVSPTSIGGLRMASEMLRPAVVTFLDVMLKRDDEQLRIEEATIPASMDGRPISDLDLKRFEALLLLAVKSGSEWLYNPPRSHVMRGGDVLVFMASPAERRALEDRLRSGHRAG